MKVLVTGGAGYIGSFMTKRLLQEGMEVTVLDSLERGYVDVIDKRATFIQADLTDRKSLSNLFSNNKFEAVIHFAGYIAVNESMKEPGKYFENNVFGALNLLEELRKNNIQKLIFSSTAGIYGNPEKIPISEDDPKIPTSPYGESKLMVEKILSWYRSTYNLNFVSLRYFNAAGASLDGNLGENHQPETHIIPNAINAALNNSEFILYGEDYDTPDGTCIRDYIHILDLVEAHMLALKRLQEQLGGHYYNVGTGKGCSNKEVIDMVKKIGGIELKVKVEERRPGDPNILIADCKKIQNELGFNPRYSDLETIIKTAWEWHKNLKAKNDK